MTRAVRRVALGLALTAVAVGTAGCGDDPTGEKAYATKVAVYLGVPLRGPWGSQGLAVAHGAELGLADSGGGIGSFSVRLSERDLTDPGDGVTIDQNGAAIEAGNMLRDGGTVGALSGVSPVSVREFGLVANQTGIAFVSASGDPVPESRADLDPRGYRLGVQLAPGDAAVAAGVVARAKAASCRRTLVVDARSPLAGSAYDLSALKPVRTITATSWTASGLAAEVTSALGRDPDCVVVSGDPSAGDPVSLLSAVRARLGGRRLFLTRGSASLAAAAFVRSRGLRAEAIVDDGVLDDTTEGRRIDALYQQTFHTPAPVGVLSGWRGMKLLLRAVGDAGADGNRRDQVAQALVHAAVPGPPAEGRQLSSGDITTPSLSVATAEPYGWRAVRALDAG